MSNRSCVSLDLVSNPSFFDSFDYVLTDCDGVLWLRNDPIPGSIESVQALKKMGKEIIYVTNNSTQSREEYVKKCQNLGFPATIDSIISTSYAVTVFLKSKNFKKKIYVIGSAGIIEELDKANIEYLPIGPDPMVGDWASYEGQLELDPDIGAVVVGFDHHISYPKLAKAASYLKNPDVLFIATNTDEQFPSGKNLILPGTGTLVAAVEVVSGRISTSVGKPHKFMLDCIKTVHPGIDFSRCIMIGDRLNTDIMLGAQHGLKTLFVGTGTNTLEDVRKLEKSSNKEDQLLVPDYYLPCLGDLQKLIETK